jgi:predicted chitinase
MPAMFDVATALERYQKLAPKLSAAAVEGFHQLLEFIHEDEAILNTRWAAYMLATVRHECAGKWLPIEEFGKGKGRPYGVPAMVQDSDGTAFTNTYYGRGYVQLTWRANYDRVGRALGMGNTLLLHPEHALEPHTSYRVMSFGMRTGAFTGKKLANYISDSACDYVNARRIINRLDQAQKIAGYAAQFEQVLQIEPLAAAASGD